MTADSKSVAGLVDVVWGLGQGVVQRVSQAVGDGAKARLTGADGVGARFRQIEARAACLGAHRISAGRCCRDTLFPGADRNRLSRAVAGLPGCRTGASRRRWSLRYA
jgi:hypothetical protein